MNHQPSFGTLLVESLVDQWVNVRTVAVRTLLTLTFVWGGVLVILNLMNTGLDQPTPLIPYLRLGLVVFLVLLTASWLAVTVAQLKRDLKRDDTPRHQLANAITTIPTIVVAALLTWSTVALTFAVLEQPLEPVIVDFASCAANGGVVLETSPLQCVTSSATYTNYQ